MDDLPAYDPKDYSHDNGSASNAGSRNSGYARSAIDQHDWRTPAASAGSIVDGIKNQLFEIAETSKSDVFRSIDGITRSIREATAQIEALGFEPLSRCARRANAFVDDIHGSIRDKSVDELIDDGRDLVSSHPEIAIVAAAIIGFIGARVLKARE